MPRRVNREPIWQGLCPTCKAKDGEPCRNLRTAIPTIRTRPHDDRKPG